MREILFRGKSLETDEWIYGDTFHSSLDAQFECIHDYKKHLNMAVDPETIGQYTGLTDKNGNKIFEGDIIRWKEYDRWAPDDNIVSGYVLYVDGQWLIQRPNIRSYLWRVHSYCKIIGNIYDNSEKDEPDPIGHKEDFITKRFNEVK